MPCAFVVPAGGEAAPLKTTETPERFVPPTELVTWTSRSAGLACSVICSALLWLGWTCAVALCPPNPAADAPTEYDPDTRAGKVTTPLASVAALATCAPVPSRATTCAPL